MKNLLKLFWNFFKIGLFTFGGGYAMISLVQNEFVDKQKAVTEEEFVDLIAIAESTPGPIAINMATFIGKKQGGFLGAVLATLGVVSPSFIIIFIISLFLGNLLQYEIVQKAFKGIACAVAVIITFAGIKLIKTFKKSFPYILIFICTFVLMVLTEIKLFKFSYLTICLIVLAGIIGLFIDIKKNKENNEQ